MSVKLYNTDIHLTLGLYLYISILYFIHLKIDEYYSPSCVGGGCQFERCLNPSCEGGGCTFVNSKKATCSGGSCHFYNPLDTLKDGYCEGGNCYLENLPWPSRLSTELSY